MCFIRPLTSVYILGAGEIFTLILQSLRLLGRTALVF